MKQGRNISFYIEIVIMLAVSVMAIAILANAFARSDAYSKKAGRLSDAVTLAASAAECFLASDSPEDLAKTLNEADNAKADGAQVVAYYDKDLKPKADGSFRLVIGWDEQGSFVNTKITVYYDDEEIYDLESGMTKGAKK